jgi:hypothetical protein
MIHPETKKGRAVARPSLLTTRALFCWDHILQLLTLVIFTFITGCKGHAAQNFAGLG